MKYLRDGFLALIIMMFVPMGSLGEGLLIPVNVGAVSAVVSEEGGVLFSGNSEEMDELSRVGEPLIPWKRIPLLLPPSTLLSSVSCTLVGDTWLPVADSAFVSPAPFYVEMYDEEGNVVPIVLSKITLVDGCNTAIYEKNAFWPTASDLVDGTSSLRGWKMVTVRVPLARYNPVQKTVEVLEQASLAVEYDLQDTTPAFDSSSAARVEERVSNYDVMGKQYLSAKERAQSKASTGNNGYVIAVSKDIQAASTTLDAFIAHKQTMGFVVTVITEDTIGSTASDTGIESATKFRSWLQANYLSLDLKYLLIIADPVIENSPSYFPMVKANDAWPDRTDYFYAELSYDWDDDNDGIWCEWSSGDPAPDFSFEVYVGRIPYYGIIADTDHILQKTIDYETETDQSWRRKVLLGATPMQPTETLSHYQSLEQTRTDHFNPAAIPVERYYNSGSTHSVEEWIQRNHTIPPPEHMGPTLLNTGTANLWSTNRYGVYLTNSHGNSGVTSGLLGVGNLNKLNDDYPAAVFLAACTTAKPSSANNLVYSLLKRGAITSIGASGTSGGWYFDVPFSRGCQGLLYRYGGGLANHKSCGEALWFDAKENMPSISLSNWLKFGLYGDPSVVVYPDRPEFTITPPHRFYGVHYANSAFNLPTQTYTIINDSDVAIQWTASKTATWFDFSAASGTIPANSTGSVELSMNAAVESFALGRHIAAFTINNTTHGTSLEHGVEFEHKHARIYRYNELNPALLDENTSEANMDKALDDKGATFWAGGELIGDEMGKKFQLNLIRDYELMGFVYSPAESSSVGRIAEYEFYISMDGEHWGAPIASGTFPNTIDLQDVVFPLTHARYVRFVAISSHDGGPVMRMADLFLHYKVPNRGMRWRYYPGVWGSDVADLLAYTQYPRAPQVDSIYADFEIDINRYGAAERYDAWLVPPTTGTYKFWLAADDSGELWLSSDSTTNNLVKIASVTEPTNSREWDKFASQESVSITLTAGVPYAIMGLHKNGGGGSSFSVAWEGPGMAQQVIASSYLSYDKMDASASTPVLGNTSFSVSEEAVMRASVGTLVATDGDAGDLLNYQILTGNEEGSFAINSTSGELYVVRPLDYESTLSYTLTVVVDDKSGKTDKATVTISVIDVVNETVFNEPPSISMVEPSVEFVRVALGNGLLLVAAISDDNLPAGSVLSFAWTMESGPDLAVFASVDSLSTSVSFPVVGEYVLRGTVSDGDKSSTIDVHIQVGGVLGDTQPIPSSGLLVHYPFNETTGTNAFDQSVNNYSATLDAELWNTNGVFGGAVYLDGQNALLIENAPNLTDIDVLKQTISFWFKADTMRNGEAISLYDGGWGNGIGIVLDGNTLFYGIAGNRSGWSATYLAANDLETDRWYHVAMVMDAGWGYYANGVRAYLDGIEIASGPASKVRVPRSHIGIGCSLDKGDIFYRNSPGGNIFEGYIDDLAVYDRALSSTEIAQMGCILSPVVNAGTDMLSSLFTTLTGSVGIDPYAMGSVSTQWDVESGPGTVLFGDASLLSTSVSFDTEGTYVLRLSAVDGKATSCDTITITVDGGAVPLSGLVVYYSFDETTGTLVLDLAGADHSGTLTGGTWQPDSGVWSGDLALNGTSDTIEIATSSAINNRTLNTRTVAFWFRADSLQGTQMLYEEGGLTRGMNLYLDGNTLHLGAWQNGSSSFVEVHTTGLVADQWYHAIFSLDTVGDQLLRGYLDGVEFGSVACSLVGSHSGAIGLGFVNDSTVCHSGNLEVESWFGGRLDDFVLYNRLLTSEEIARLSHINSAPVLANAAFSIQENSAAGSVVGTVSATDPDASDVHVYSILSGNGDGKFAIGVFSGEITLVGAIDYETLASYVLTVRVSDLSEEDTATVSISIINEVNDDSDSDGLTDDWEAIYFGSTAAQDASGDPDSDGVTNLQEENLGSDPNDAAFPGAEYADLRAWWKLDETSGTLAADYSGNGWDASNTNGVLVNQTGQIDGAFGFDGIDDFSETQPAPAPGSNITITAWIRPSDLSGSQTILSKDNSFVFKLYGSTLRFTTPGHRDHSGLNNLTADEWQFVAVTFVPNTTSGCRFYRNGTISHSTDSFGMTLNGNSLMLGNNQWNEHFAGRLDDVRLYGRILTDTEVADLYHKSISHIYLSDIDWVSATTGWGTIHKDRSINNRAITLDGTTYPKGLGTHAQSEIVYNLAGNYVLFHSIVGVDDETGSNGSVAFKVYGDDVLLYETAVITAVGTETLRIDVTDVQTLKLVADDGGDGIGNDHADWADAYIVSKSAGVYTQWKYSKFTSAELANSAISGDDADVDADQLSTLIEYALGFEPKTHSGSFAGCAIELDGSNGWKVEFNRHASHNDIDFVLEWTDELNPANWQPVAESIAGGVVQPLNGATLVSETGSEPTVVELNIPSTVPHGFIRWTVERR